MPCLFLFLQHQKYHTKGGLPRDSRRHSTCVRRVAGCDSSTLWGRSVQRPGDGQTRRGHHHHLRFGLSRRQLAFRRGGRFSRSRLLSGPGHRWGHALRLRRALDPGEPQPRWWEPAEAVRLGNKAAMGRRTWSRRSDESEQRKQQLADELGKKWWRADPGNTDGLAGGHYDRDGFAGQSVRDALPKKQRTLGCVWCGCTLQRRITPSVRNLVSSAYNKLFRWQDGKLCYFKTYLAGTWLRLSTFPVCFF